MARWGSSDFRELRDLNKRIRAAASKEQADLFYKTILNQMMNSLLKDVKDRTPVDTGHLKRNWFITRAQTVGKQGYAAEIYNNVEYAPWVENGHRIMRNGAQVGFVEGKYMLQDSVLDLEKAAPAYTKQKSEVFLRQVMGSKW